MRLKKLEWGEGTFRWEDVGTFGILEKEEVQRETERKPE